MKTIKETIEALSVHETFVYKNDYLKPFIETYLQLADIKYNSMNWQLLHMYKFGFDVEDKSVFSSERYDLFIGYRWLSRKFRPLFVSIWKSKKENNDECDYFNVNGFSTFYDKSESDWFKVYKDCGFVESIPIKVPIDNGYRMIDDTPPLYKQLENMGKVVLKHLNNRKH